VAFSKVDGEWLVRGEARRGGIDGGLVLAHDELADLKAVDLRDALASKAEFSGHRDAAAGVSPLSLANLDTDVVGIEVGFEYRDENLLVTAMHFGEWRLTWGLVGWCAIRCAIRDSNPEPAENHSHNLGVTCDCPHSLPDLYGCGFAVAREFAPDLAVSR
jgi:hypothetical protein